MEHYSSSVQETEALGRALAQHLTPGTVVAFTGDLGAGKTAFVRGMAQGLGIAQRVTSPTFTIVNEYEGGRLPLFHFDMYRLGSADDLFDIGWEDFLRRGGRLRRGVERDRARGLGRRHHLRGHPPGRRGQPAGAHHPRPRF